jgi:hypothetical protein
MLLLSSNIDDDDAIMGKTLSMPSTMDGTWIQHAQDPSCGTRPSEHNINLVCRWPNNTSLVRPYVRLPCGLCWMLRTWPHACRERLTSGPERAHTVAARSSLSHCVTPWAWPWAEIGRHGLEGARGHSSRRAKCLVALSVCQVQSTYHISNGKIGQNRTAALVAFLDLLAPLKGNSLPILAKFPSMRDMVVAVLPRATSQRLWPCPEMGCLSLTCLLWLPRGVRMSAHNGCNSKPVAN